MSPGRKEPPFSFFLQSFRSGQWSLSSSYLRNSLWSCWAKGSCRGAAVKRRFPPFHWSREGLLPHHSGLIGIEPMLKVACLPKKLVSPENEEALLSTMLSTKLCFSSCSRNIVATLIQKVSDGSRLSPLSATVTICHSDYFIHKQTFFYYFKIAIGFQKKVKDKLPASFGEKFPSLF